MFAPTLAPGAPMTPAAGPENYKPILCGSICAESGAVQTVPCRTCGNQTEPNLGHVAVSFVADAQLSQHYCTQNLRFLQPRTPKKQSYGKTIQDDMKIFARKHLCGKEGLGEPKSADKLFCGHLGFSDHVL